MRELYMAPKPLDEEAIFKVACRITASEARDEYLQQICGDNHALSARVTKLLHVYHQQPSFLENAGANVVATLDLSVSSAGIGASIGPYKIREQLAEGGMGVVYVAEQTKPVRRKVALKVIKPGMASKDVVARFEAERQSLAMMDHPNIARVFDGGATDSGQPYFVMELVQGLPITDYCDERRLSTRERLELFAKVCRAVQHAHQKGIIHRDLKPSNVLVAQIDGESAPKVIDFGVAKAVSQKLTEQTVYTQFSQMIGTPLYMSPEQAEMGIVDIDTRSDVYSLGALLYELLTGNTPFDRETVKQVGFDELRRVIREDEPRRPSAAISTLQAQALSTVANHRHCDARNLSHSLKGELDWLVMKALEKDRNRRYESPNAMAADIERYLDNEPVEACPPSVGYRMRKFAQRHRTQIVTGSLLTLAMLIVVGVSAGFVLDKQAREEQILREAQNVEQSAVQSVETSLTSARTAIKAGNIELASTAIGEAQGHLAPVREDHPELVGQLQSLNDEIHQRRVDSERFTTFMEQFRNAEKKIVRGDRNEFQDLAKDALAYYSVLSDEDWLDQLKNSHLTEQQQTTVRETVYETLLLLGDSGPRSSNSIRQEQSQAGLEYLQRAEAFHEPTRAFFWVRSECNKVLKNKQATEKDLVLFKQTEAKTAFDYFLPGHTAGWRGDLDEAVRSYEAALRIQPDHHNSLFFLAVRLSSLGRNAEAAQVFRACLALRPNDASALSNRGALLSKLGFHDEAIDHCNKAIEINPEFASAYNTRGVVYAGLKRFDQALIDFNKSIEVDPEDAESYRNRGVFYIELKQFDKALKDYSKAIELDPKNTGAFNNRGWVYQELKQFDKSLEDYNKAIEIDPKNSSAYSNRGGHHFMLKQFDKALEDVNHAILLMPGKGQLFLARSMVHSQLLDYDQAVADLNKAIELDPKCAGAYNNLACLRIDCPDPAFRNAAQALDFAIKAVEIDPDDAANRNTLGHAQYLSGDFSGAIQSCTKSLELDESIVCQNSLLLAMAHWQLGQRDEAQTWHDKATQWLNSNPSTDESLAHLQKEAKALIGSNPLGIPETNPPLTAPKPDSF